MKTFYIYEADEGKLGRLLLEQEQKYISAFDELELVALLNSKKFTSSLHLSSYENEFILTDVPPSSLINEKSLPYKSKYMVLYPSERVNFLNWKIYN